MAGTVTLTLSSPPAPGNLRSTGSTSSSISLAWDAVPSAVNYALRRGGAVIVVQAGTTYDDTGRAADTTYSYTVSAFRAGGESVQSAAINVTTQASGGNLLFDANYSTTSLGGTLASEDRLNQFYTLALQSGAGPSGQTALRLSQIAGTTGQDSWGSDCTVDAVAFPNNNSRFLRIRFRMGSTNNNRSVDWTDGGNAKSENKFVIIGGGTGRWIINTEGYVYNDPEWGWTMQIDGGSQRVTRYGLSNNVWYDIQMELRYGSNAYAKLWLDDMTYASPWLQTDTFSQSPPAGYSDSWRIGGFRNHHLESPGGVFFFDHCDLEIGTTFDVNW